MHDLNRLYLLFHNVYSRRDRGRYWKRIHSIGHQQMSHCGTIIIHTDSTCTRYTHTCTHNSNLIKEEHSTVAHTSNGLIHQLLPFTTCIYTWLHVYPMIHPSHYKDSMVHIQNKQCLLSSNIFSLTVLTISLSNFTDVSSFGITKSKQWQLAAKERTLLVNHL